MTNLLKRGGRIGKLEDALGFPKGQILNADIPFHIHRRRCTHACEGDQFLTPKGPFVSLKRLLNESVFSTGSPEPSRKGTQCDVSQYLLLSEPRSQSARRLLSFWGLFYPFSVGKVINLPPGSGAVYP